MEWEAIKAVITTGGATGAVVGIAFYVIRSMMTLGDKYLSMQLQNQMTIISSHEKERGAWMTTLTKFNEAIDRSSGYQREEHSKMILILEGLERASKN